MSEAIETYELKPVHEDEYVTSAPLPAVEPINCDINIDALDRQKFIRLVESYKGCSDWMRLPLPAWAYETIPEFKGTEFERVNENEKYARTQINEKDPEVRKSNCKARLQKKLADKSQQRRKAILGLDVTV